MNLTNATSVTINNKTVERILINGKTVYNTIQMLLSTNKEHIKTDESAIVNIESNIKNKTIELWKVINMTRTSMGTQTTGSDGKASWTYTGAGAGEVQFIATYDDIESNTVTIEDYNPVIMRAVLTADKTTIISGESVTLTCNYFDQYNELTADYYSSNLYDGSTIVDSGDWECPDVFTVSGLSVGTHSFKVVVTNHDNSVVDSNIVSVVVENSFDGMSLGLSAGSQILSYADEQTTPNSQYATVTAQLLKGQSSATVSNVPVVFGAYLNNVLITGSEQTVNTDSNGQASYTYHSAGRGDVVVKAVPDNRTLLTKTFSIRDGIFYDVSSSSNVSKYGSSSAFSYNSTEQAYYITTSSAKNITRESIVGDFDFEISMDFKITANNTLFYCGESTSGYECQGRIVGSSNSSEKGVATYYTNGSIVGRLIKTSYSLDTTKWYHLKVTRESNVLTTQILDGDTVIATATDNNVTGTTGNVSWHNYVQTGTMYWKNILFIRL